MTQPCDCATVTENLARLQSAVAELQGFALVQGVKGVTDANGNLTMDWPTAFSGTPTVVLGLQTSVAEAHSARIVAVSATAVSVHVARSPLVPVLGINVAAAMTNASGVTVHAIAVGAP